MIDYFCLRIWPATHSSHVGRFRSCEEIPRTDGFVASKLTCRHSHESVNMDLGPPFVCLKITAFIVHWSIGGSFNQLTAPTGWKSSDGFEDPG